MLYTFDSCRYGLYVNDCFNATISGTESRSELRSGENFLNLRSSIFPRPMYFLDVHDDAHDAGKCFLANALHCQGCSKAAYTRPPFCFKIRRWATSSQHVDALAASVFRKSFFLRHRRKVTKIRDLHKQSFLKDFERILYYKFIKA